MAEDKNLLELKGVFLAFEGKEILKGVDLFVPRQSRVVVMGGSGSGKSTLLRLVLGILKPNRGGIFFDGVEVNRLENGKLNELRKKIGMVFQDSALVSSLNVRDNLALPLQELTDHSKQEIDRIVDEKLEMVDMAKSKELMPSELSGGMKKRVGLARALVLDPELILFDEPSSALDPANSKMIDELILDLSEKAKATCVIVTHELKSAFRIGTLMSMLHEGKIVFEGEPDAFRDSKDPVVVDFLEGDGKTTRPSPRKGNHANAQK